MEWNLESKDYLGFFYMGRYDWLRARDNHPIIINLLSTKLPNPTFYLSSSRFVKKAEMETPLYKSYFLGKTKIMGYKSKHDVILNRNIAI